MGYTSYFKNKLSGDIEDADELDTKLRQLISFDNIQPFQENKIKEKIIKAIDACSILDPACGSGAFPMGILQKMVHLLHKLDPGNERWKQRQIDKVNEAVEKAEEIEDNARSQSVVKELKEQIKDIEDSFENNELDYGRKLYLLENCIYGVDIQPIAAQISKLRFFISLIVDQSVDKNKENFGIRPLPNLETKFVAANTLIGIEKPKEQGELFDNPKIKKLEDSLKKVRHKLFSSKSPGRKRELRDEDKTLRDQIAELLIEGGWENKAARQLASWDPYDQNASSPFFDSEWMFGIKDGFDVVIGNPPYASAVTMARSKELKALYKKLYPLATGSYDIYVLFLYNALDLLNNIGIFSWIIPNKFLVADYAASTKSYLINNGLCFSIDVSTFNVFENASVYPIVILGDKSKLQHEFQEFMLSNYKDLEKRHFKEPIKLKDHKLIKEQGLKLASGTTGFEAKKIKGLLSEEVSENSIPFTVSGCIDKFIISNRNVRYMGEKLEKAFVNKSSIIAVSKWSFWKSSKVVIAGMTKEIEAVYVKEPFGLGVGVYAVYGFAGFDPYCLAGILNSSYLTYYFRNKFKDKHLAGGYLAINKSTLEQLPLERPKNDMSYILLSKILHYNGSKQSTDAQSIQIVLNAIVFELYFPDHMKEKEIDILKFVEQDLKEVLGEDDFEQLPDEQKEAVIEELHKRWSNPNREIVKRMNSFAEKSPDILKPILESK